MATEQHSFIFRANRFFTELKSRQYPNAVTLAEKCECSKNTAQRTIYRLRDEYQVPLDYDSSEKGYFLTNAGYQFPTLLPPGKDELTALLLAREFLSGVDAPDVTAALDHLWVKYSNNSAAARGLEGLSRVFSCDSTMVADLADHGILRIVNAAQAGESLRLSYKSPWRHAVAKTYEGRALRAHFSDGNLYILFKEVSGRELILNAAFIKNFEVLDYDLSFAVGEKDKAISNWLDGFGVWSGDPVEEIEVEILHPASEYYASQRWHEDQKDEWRGDVLVRKFPGIVSPEVTKRILSLGRFIKSIKPETLAAKVLEDALALAKALKGAGVIGRVS